MFLSFVVVIFWVDDVMGLFEVKLEEFNIMCVLYFKLVGRIFVLKEKGSKILNLNI